MASFKRVLVTGGTGLLGTEVVAAFGRAAGVSVAAPPRRELDVADRGRVSAFVQDFRPDLVVNCAAFTRVDDCESREAHANLVNADGAGLVAEAAARAEARLIHLSTDYVFSGEAARPHREDDPAGPAERLCAYGRSKLAGESRVLANHPAPLIVRTAWLYGPGGPCFPRTILRIARQQSELRVVDDQRGDPTYSVDLAEAIVRLAATEARGVIHVANAGECTWYEFAREIVRLAGINVRVVPVTTADVPRPARRPAYSVLDTTRFAELTGGPLRPWRDALAACLPTMAGPG